MSGGRSASELVLRDMKPEDVPAGLRLCRVAGWNQRAEDWQALLAEGVFRVAGGDAPIGGAGGARVDGPRRSLGGAMLGDTGERPRGGATRLMYHVPTPWEADAGVGPPG